MISLNCTNCRASLEMDDAFAGSTCRCHHCGTIQTVPRKRAAAPRAAVGASAQRVLHTESRRAAGSGLDQIADAVAVSSSSGLQQAAGIGSGVGSGSTATLTRPAASRSAALAPAPPTKSVAKMLAIGGAGGVVTGLIIGIAIFFSNGNQQRSPQPIESSGAKGNGVAAAIVEPASGAAPAVGAMSPAFCGIALDGLAVVYVLDRGSSGRESLGYLVEATLKSARTLGRDRKFQIVFWDNGQEAVSYPPQSPGYATPETIAAAARACENVIAFGRSDAAPALRRAAAGNPQAIVLVTAKGWELDDDFVQSALLARGHATAKIHAISIGGSESGEAMEKIAKATGGTFKAVTVGDLKDFARD